MALEEDVKPEETKLSPNIVDLIKVYAESYASAKKRGSQLSMDNQDKHVRNLGDQYPAFKKEIDHLYQECRKEKEEQMKTDTQRVA